MVVKKDLELIHFAIGLYEQALKLLEPGGDDFSVLSGCILLTVGLEKLIKSVLYRKNPLMILYRKIDFEDLVAFEQGERFNNQETISFENALKRLVQLFPCLAKEAKDIEYIVKERNFLMHNFGYIDIGALEKRVQTKVADISKLICIECLGITPRELFGEAIWDRMTKIREAYKQADILEIDQRVKHLKRLYLQGENLPCDLVDISEEMTSQTIICPVCEKSTAKVVLEWDVDVDHREGTVMGVYPYLSLIRCQCGFAMQDVEEIELLLAARYSEVIDSILNS